MFHVYVRLTQGYVLFKTTNTAHAVKNTKSYQTGFVRNLFDANARFLKRVGHGKVNDYYLEDHPS